MGIQTMASRDSGGGAAGAQHPQVQNLARQGSSLYSLTLDEVQSHLGEPLHSMNLDELLTSVFPWDPSSSMDAEGISSDCASSSGLRRQGSIAMPRGLSKKTVDEVWKDIQEWQRKHNTTECRAGRERQATFGEMTLEAFLEKAGVITEGYAKNGHDPASGVACREGSSMSQYHQMSEMHLQQQAQVQNSIITVYDTYRDGQLGISSPGLGGALSDSQTPGQKRGASEEVVDKLVERRQKRMIKNRESAARSRARKQAYTNELENKVNRLEEENVRLKKQKELDAILRAPPLEPKYQLRRTSSAAF